MKKRSFTAEYKARIVLEMLREERTASEIAAREQISVTQLSGWKREFLDNAARAFGRSKEDKELEEQLEHERLQNEALAKKVGQLAIEADWLKKKHAQMYGPDWEEKSGYKRR